MKTKKLTSELIKVEKVKKYYDDLKASEQKKQEVINLFLTKKDNRTSVISKIVNLSISSVNNILDGYLNGLSK